MKGFRAGGTQQVKRVPPARDKNPSCLPHRLIWIREVQDPEAARYKIELFRLERKGLNISPTLKVMSGKASLAY